MGALMGERKAALPAELAYLERLNKARIHQDLIAVQREGILHPVFLNNVLGICISRQPTDASIGRQVCKRDIEAEIFAGKLVNRCTARQTRPIGIRAEEELVEVLRDRCCDLFNISV